MLMKIRTEQKYYCLEPERLTNIAEKLGFKLVSKINEIDEYFTDINGEFVKNRTCLRIRKNENNKMEITFKGKSNSLLGLYCKLENNFNVDYNEYDNFVSLFSSLGYYSYVEVVKDRIIFKLQNKKYEYSIMIDNLDTIGGFVEFEILSLREDDGKEELKSELSNFIFKFDDLHLKEVNEPYSDIVAKHMYTCIVNNDKVIEIYIDIDSEIMNYERNFFKKYKDKISKVCGSNIRWGEYKNNKLIDKRIVCLVDEYLDNLLFDSNQLLVTIELLKKLKYKRHFITKVNEVFFMQLFNKLNVTIDDVIYLKNESLLKVFKSNNICAENAIIINEKDLKKINSLLLIMLNN